LSKRLITTLAGVVAIAVIAAGCGSSSDDSSSSSDEGASLSKAEFIKEGDAICEKGNQSIESEAEEFAEENGIDVEKPTTAEQEEVVSDVVGPGIATEAEEIGALGAPSGEEAEVEAIVAAVEAGAEEAEENPSSIVEVEGGGPFAEANKLANNYGFKICGGE
jgi:maltose-binding protein MalE